MDLQTFFSCNPKAALAFSGGTDSAYLLYAGRQAGADIKAYYIKTVFQPQFELDDAARLARQLGVALEVIHTDILSDEAIAANPPDRCYFCKRRLFQLLWEHARQDGYPVLMDGTNASDDAGDRPGMRALRELHVCSPLRESGISKEDIRRLSMQAGLFTWNKPSYACLCTRIPSGTRVTTQVLQNIERAEAELFALGFSDFRVRVFHSAARLQVTLADFPKAVAQRDAVRRRLAPYFETVFLDLQSR